MVGILLQIIKSKWTLGISGVLIILSLYSSNRKLRTEVERADNNYNILVGESEEALELKQVEFNTYVKNSEFLERILRDSLKIKTSQVKSLSQATSSTKIVIRSILKDTTIFVPVPGELVKIPVGVHKFEFKDTWVDISGLVFKDSVDLNISSSDTLAIVEYKYKNRKWFLTKLFEKWKTRQEIGNSNPYMHYKITHRVEVLK
jgi:hypothetical protein